MKGRLVMLVVAAGAGAVALSYYGRYAMRRELAPWGEPDVSAVVASLSTYEAMRAGARALIGRSPIPYSGSVTVQT